MERLQIGLWRAPKRLSTFGWIRPGSSDVRFRNPRGDGSFLPEVRTLVWPNGADFDPAILHDWPQHEAAMKELAKRWALAMASVGSELPEHEVGLHER